MCRNEDIFAAHFLEPGDQMTTKKPCSASDHNSLIAQINHECLPSAADRKLKGLGPAFETSFQLFDVGLNHDADQLREGYSRFPVQDLPCFRSICAEIVDLGRPKVARINLHVLMPIQVSSCESKFDEFTTVWASPVPIT